MGPTACTVAGSVASVWLCGLKYRRRVKGHFHVAVTPLRHIRSGLSWPAMDMNLNVATLGFEVDLGTTIRLATEHGFTGIDLPLDEVAALPDPVVARDQLEAVGLRWGGFGLPVDFRNDEDRFRADLEQLRRQAPVAEQVGCTRCSTWIFPGHDELACNANFARHVDRLALVAACLAAHGIRLGLEFVGPVTLRTGLRHEFVHTMEGMLHLADAIEETLEPKAPKVGLLLDAFHWWTSGAAETTILERTSADRIVYVHVNDGRAGRARDEQIDQERELPCKTGVIDAGRFMRCLRDMGYDGPITVEPFSAALRELPVDEAVRQTAESMRKLFAL